MSRNQFTRAYTDWTADDPTHPRSPSQIQTQWSQSEKKSKKSRRWDRLRAVTEKYMRESSIHGVKFLLEPLWWEKLFWVVAIVVSAILAAYFTARVFLKWQQDPVYVAFDTESTPIWKLPFPAVTVCNMNQVNLATVADIASRLNSSSLDEGDEKWTLLQGGLLENMCADIDFGLGEDNNIKLEEGQEEEVEEFLDGLGQPCESLLKKCFLTGVERDCSQLFHTTFIDLGLCCSFNVLPAVLLHDKPWEKETSGDGEEEYWNPQSGFREPPKPVTEDNELGVPFRSLSSGVTNGLSFTLDIQAAKFACPVHSSRGFKIMLHSTTSNPFMIDHGKVLSTGREHFVTAIPEVVQASKGIYGIEPRSRKCLLHSEGKLAFYEHYTEENCRIECQANHTMDVCGCVPHFLPHFSGQPLCDPEQVLCHDALKIKIRDDAALEDGGIFTACDCLQGCTEIRYGNEVSSAEIDPASVRRRMGLDPAGDDVFDDAYVADNVATVNVFFEHPTLTQHSRSELFGTVDFVANIGGLMGLFLGVSAISLVEIVYYFCKGGVDGSKKEDWASGGGNNRVDNMTINVGAKNQAFAGPAFVK